MGAVSMDVADLKNRFSYHAPDEQKVLVHGYLREACFVLAKVLANKLPDSREKSLAMTSLEETMMWANAAIARMDEAGNRL